MPRCITHCPPASGGVRVPWRALAALAVAAVAVSWLAQEWVPVLATAAVLAVVVTVAAAAGVKALRVVFRWLEPLYIFRPQRAAPVRVTVRTVAPRALKARPLAIGSRPVVTATVLASDYERQAVR